MRKRLRSAASLLCGLAISGSLFAQERYLDEIFTDAEIVKAETDLVYGINVDFLSNQSLVSAAYVNANMTQIMAEHNEIRDSILSGIANGTPPNIPVSYFTPYSLDPSTEIKLINPIPNDPVNGSFNPFEQGMLDIYMPNPAVDPETARPVIIFAHTGNFFPKGLNGGISGNKDDSIAVELCKQWAKRGYVAIAPNYRLGWNPTATNPSDRTRTLLNGVYRAIGDLKQVVRLTKMQASTLMIDPDKIVLYGQGSGGYVTLAYNFLDKHSETELPKFDPDGTGQLVIDTNIAGTVDGFGGVLNFYQYQMSPAITDDVAMVANAGGALGDTSWIDGGENPVVTFHSVRDEFAPYQAGTVIVPTTGEPVVDALGPNTFMPMVNALGLNDAFKDLPSLDPYTNRARAVYGQVFSTDLPIINGPGDITVVGASGDAEGLFAMDSPLGYSAPWEYWSDTDFQAYHGYLTQLGFAPPLLAPAADILANAANGNVNQKSSSLMYTDTIQGYLQPRIMRALEIGNWEALSVNDVTAETSGISVYPNPAHNLVRITSAHGSQATVQFTDMTGRVVMMDRVQTESGYVDISELPSGLYIVSVESAGAKHTQKLIIEE